MIPHRRVVLGLAIVLLGACAAPHDVEQSAGKTAWFEWAILPVERGPELGHPREGYWRPHADTVQAALDRIPGYLKAQWEAESPPEGIDLDDWHEMVWGLREKLPAYRCQVIGIVESGRKLVYLNFAHYMSFEPHSDEDSKHESDWHTEPHVVDDGGDHYWQAEYDPATATFVAVSVNGEA